MTTWTTRAAAKLNLTLEVLGKRTDGFHDLASVVVSLDLADQVSLSTDGAARRITYRSDAGHAVSIETDNDIVARAWKVLAQECPLPAGGAVEVIKRIPITSGLGGGSTDAAAFLRLARAAWRLELSDDELCAIGARIGSDVPVCIRGGPMLMEGRGERLTPLRLPERARQGWSVLLHRPEIPVPANKTAAMYRSLRSSNFRSGNATTRLVERLTAGRAPTQDDCVNSFDAPAREVMHGLTRARQAMGGAVARAAAALGQAPPVPLLAGAGPTLFAVMSSDAADRAAAQLRGASGFTCTARPLSAERAAAVQQR